MLLRFDIKDIVAHTLHVSREVPGEDLSRILAAADLMEPAPSLSLDLRLYAVDQTVVVQGKLHGRFTVACGRCLGPCPIRVDEPDLCLTFLPPEMRPDTEEELELSADDLDTAYHDGEVVDLSPAIRDQLLLAIPITPVCSEGCLGLCGQCGADLNRNPCSCVAEETPQSHWVTALSKVKIG